MKTSSTHSEAPIGWITWEKQVRNRSLSKAIDAELVELVTQSKGLTRYTRLLLKTFPLIVGKRFRALVVQNPSIVLAFFATLTGRIVGKKIVVDAHNAGVFPLEGESHSLQSVAHLIFRLAHSTIVSNAILATYVKSKGGSPIIVPDPLPSFPRITNPYPVDRGFFNILFVCTWAADEPYINVMEAIGSTDLKIRVYISGNYRKKLTNRCLSSLPENAVLTGFLKEDDYTRLLQAVDGVIDLTTRDACLVCGAYESVSMGKPAILSNNSATRNYFHQGVVYCDNSIDGIRDAIVQLVHNHAELARKTNLLRKELREYSPKHLGALLKALRY